MNSSLFKLSSYLPDDSLKILKKELGDLSDYQFKLLRRKVIFTYEYIDSIEKLKDTQLPPIENIYSTLMSSNVSSNLKLPTCCKCLKFI